MKIRSLRLSSRILLMIIPSMSALLFALAQFVYAGLYETIIQGFEGKLRVLGSLNSALIDGSQHFLLNDFRQETAICHDPVNDLVYFGYATGKMVTRMHVPDNRFDGWESPDVPGAAHMAFDQIGRQLVSVEYQGSNISVRDIRTLELKKVITSPGQPQGLACESNNLYAVITNTLFCTSLSVTNGEWITIGKITDGHIWGLTVDSRGMLAALDMQKSTIIRFSSTNTAMHEIVSIGKTNTAEHAKYLPLRGIARIGSKYICGSPIEPVTVEATTGELRPMNIGQDKNRSLRDVYADMTGVLSKVREKAGLTYMPSVVITRDLKSLVYVADSVADEFHSLDGYVDPTVLEEGIIDSWTKNRPYISAVKFWEDYGLMKSSYYPILDTSGTITALLAADINVSIIRDKTMDAVRRVAVSGSITLLAGIILAFSIARRIVKPVMNLKEFALRVAAGGYGEQINASGADEIRQLMIAYNAVSTSTGKTLEALYASSAALDTARKIQELKNTLDGMAGASVFGPSYRASRLAGSNVSLSQTKSHVCIVGGLQGSGLASAVSVVLQNKPQSMADDVLALIRGMGIRYTSCILWDSVQHVVSWDCGLPLDLYVWRKKSGTIEKVCMEGKNDLRLDGESMACLGYQEDEVSDIINASRYEEGSIAEDGAKILKENFKLVVMKR